LRGTQWVCAGAGVVPAAFSVSGGDLLVLVFLAEDAVEAAVTSLRPSSGHRLLSLIIRPATSLFAFSAALLETEDVAVSPFSRERSVVAVGIAVAVVVERSSATRYRGSRNKSGTRGGTTA
jgi:hypothetical protein